MFGYLLAATGILSEEQQERYKACYCGLCRSLRKRHGIPSSFTLNYDMTFLVLLVNSLYEPEEESSEESCPVHPIKGRSFWQSEATDYAADMNLALAYYKCMDDWEDDRNAAALAGAKLLYKPFLTVCEKYPRQCGAMEKAISQLHEIEASGLEEPDAAAAAFGGLMAETLVYREDRWAESLRAMGMALGEFIYVMDACLDLDGDYYKGRYNPFLSFHGLDDNEERFRDILKMKLGECLMNFDRLPLVQDVGIMQNILCAGLWAQFNKKYSDEREGPSDDSGSL